MRDLAELQKAMPFGNPEGSIADFSQDFIEIVGFSGRGIETQPSDLRVRAFIGRKGSGKTLYLRRLEDFIKNTPNINESVYPAYTDGIQRDIPDSTQIMDFAKANIAVTDLSEDWKRIFKAAILIAVVSHIKNAENGKYFEKTKNSELYEFSKKEVFENDDVKLGTSIFFQVNRILERNTTRKEMQAYLLKPVWNEFETFIADLLHNSPPMFLFVDELDENYGKGAKFWFDFQRGFFLAINYFLKEARFHGRLHIIACIRESVYTSILNSIHGDRFLDKQHYKVLSWSRDAISFFISKKLTILHSDYFVRPVKSKDEKSIYSWLGIEKIFNDTKKIEENIVDYIIRHTTMLPRDIVNLGNSLCDAVIESKMMQRQLLAQDIKNLVHTNAKIIANRQIENTIVDILSSLFVDTSDRSAIGDQFMKSQIYHDYIFKVIQEVIQEVNNDYFDYNQLRSMNEKFLKRISSIERLLRFANIDSINFSEFLWKNSLIGYLDIDAGNKFIFYTEQAISELQLSQKREIYVFHPILNDYFGLRASYLSPIAPF